MLGTQYGLAPPPSNGAIRTTALPPYNELKGDPIWTSNVKVLFASGRASEIVPSKDMTYEERINAMVRFSLYASSLMYLFNQDPKYLVFGLALIAMLSGIYSQNDTSTTTWYREFRGNNVAPVEKVPCQMSTPDNVFGSFLLSDDMNRPQACPQTDPTQAALTRQHFNAGLPYDPADVKRADACFRQFATLPNRGPLADQSEFAQFCYGSSGQERVTRML